MSANAAAAGTQGVAEFDTRGPVRIEVDLAFGVVTLKAGPRETTGVVVRPAIATRRADCDLAAATVVDFIGGTLRIMAPHRGLTSLWRPGAVDVLVEAPSGSSVVAELGYASLSAQGALAKCRIRSSYGDVRLEHVDELEVKTTGGHVAVGLVRGSATIANSYGSVRIGMAQGPCELRNSAGDVLVDTARADVAIRTSYGAITVVHALAGSIEIATSYGASDIGIAADTAVRLDLFTKNGRIDNTLTPTGSPDASGASLALTVRSGWGDIAVRRSSRDQGGL